MYVPVINSNIILKLGLVNVYDSLFLLCKSQDGGGIFSDYDCKASILFCTFINCSANVRGGAFLIKQGDITVVSCCAIECTGGMCPDMICWTPRIAFVSMIQCFRSKSKNHLCYFSSTDSLNVKNANATSCESSSKERYSGINIGKSDNFNDLKFINVNECSAPGVITYERSCIEIDTKFYNAINNSNTICLIYFANQKSSLLHVYNSYFLYNKVSTFYSLFASTDVNLHLKNCSFSFNSQEANGVTEEFCMYNVISNYIPSHDAYCYQHGKHTCKHLSSRNNNYLLIYIFISS